uniref:Uncharacterized protein n=1 Tax=Mesocestoides corti TaxID=53468 RepID=A0A5K3EV49_MESCO
MRAQTCWTTWPQPIPCPSAIQWHAGKEGSQPEKDMDEMQYIMSGVASVADSDGRARVFYIGWQRMRLNNANRTPALSLQWTTDTKILKCQLKAMAVIRCPIHWIQGHCPGLGPLHLKRHW